MKVLVSCTSLLYEVREDKLHYYYLEKRRKNKKISLLIIFILLLSLL